MGCMADRTLLLVDGSSYLYRAYHALPDLRTKSGFPTGAIRGVVSMMKLLREQYPAAHGACVFDAKGKTFRDDWYAERGSELRSVDGQRYAAQHRHHEWPVGRNDRTHQ